MRCDVCRYSRPDPAVHSIIVRTFRDKLFTEIFPGREWVPKTLIFAKDDAHAENIVEIVREEFGKGNDFAQKITYRTTGAKPKDLINELRASPMTRIASRSRALGLGSVVLDMNRKMIKALSDTQALTGNMKRHNVPYYSL